MKNLTLTKFDRDTDLEQLQAWKKLYKSMPEYKKMSDSIKLYQSTCSKKNSSDLSKSYLSSIYPGLHIDEKNMLSEIGAFIDDTQITIMLTSYNSAKGKTTI
jgi:hypothetical protein